MNRSHPYCPYCGAKFPAESKWPRCCEGCGRFSFLNPIPVGVVLQPVDEGILVIRRGIEPHKGSLALPGGFIDVGEGWRQGCARELFEETGLSIDAQNITLFSIRDVLQPSLILFFGLAPPISFDQLPLFIPNKECTECLVITKPVELAFPLHTKSVYQFFENKG